MFQPVVRALQKACDSKRGSFMFPHVAKCFAQQIGYEVGPKTGPVSTDDIID